MVSDGMKQKAYRHWVCILLMTATITVMFGFGRNVMVVTWPDIIDRFVITYADVGNLTAVHQVPICSAPWSRAVWRCRIDRSWLSRFRR